MSTAHGQAGADGPEQGTKQKHTAGAYDVRTVIAGLIGLYGVVLTVLGVVDYSDADRAKTGDVNANLWAGLVMIVVALAFVLWLWLRPIVLDQGHAVDDDDDEG